MVFCFPFFLFCLLMLIVYVLWISDVGMNHYVFLCPLYMPKLLQKRLGWQIFGYNMGSGRIVNLLYGD